VSARTAALWPTYNPQDRKVGATCDSTPFFGKYDIAEWVGCARTVTRDLYNEVENPTPRNRFERWFERRVAQRYFMMAALGGLLAAIILGMLGLAVGIFQAWVAYQQWRFPVSNS
jgi:hypothetical protein